MMRKAAFPFLIFVLASLIGKGQTDTIYTEEYIDKSTRFAWMTFGVDLHYHTGGTSEFLQAGVKTPVQLGATTTPRMTIGGIHFWGHADFYVTFPLGFLTLHGTPSELQQQTLLQGVETGARVYPWKLAPGKLRPFAGISFRRFQYAQADDAADGYIMGVPNYGTFIYPVQFGVTYSTDRWMFSASSYYNYQNRFSYVLSPTETAAVELDPFSFNLSLIRYFDADRGMRTKQAVANANAAHRVLDQKGKLSAWFFGIGPSSALQVSKSPFLQANYPHFYEDHAASIMPDLSFGRFFHRPDMNVNLTYRTYGNRYRGFDDQINIRRHSIGLESVKFLFNYLGFVPFVGPVISYENLHTRINGTSFREDKVAAGVTFGWDIRVTKTGTGLLRTNLRYFPQLHQNIQGERMLFDHLEFNFIQWVQFIGRKKVLKGAMS
jgi:hypothetical protein